MEKNKLMMIVIIAILAIMLAAVGFGFVYTIRMIGKIDGGSTDVPEPSAISQEYDMEGTTIIPLSEALKANLLPENDGVEHLALVSMSIAVAGPAEATKKEKKQNDKDIAALVATLQAKEVVVRDTAIRLLRKSTYSDLRRADGQEILSDLIATELQDKFGSNFIVEIFFSEFFLQ